MDRDVLAKNSFEFLRKSGDVRHYSVIPFYLLLIFVFSCDLGFGEEPVWMSKDSGGLADVLSFFLPTFRTCEFFSDLVLLGSNQT